MLKTIKTTKQMRLDELIKYVWDNDIRSETLESKFGIEVRIGGNQAVIMNHYVGRDDTFTVEVEEPITENTEFQTLVAADAEGDACLMYKGTIDEIRDSITTEIYANINGKLQLIWERDE